MKNKYKHLAKNTILISIGTFGSKTISFFLLPLFTRVLTKGDYGKIDFFSTTVSLLTIFLSIEIAAAVFRFSADGKEESREILSSSYLIIAFSTILLLIFFPLFSKLSTFFSEIKYYLLFSIILGITTAINKNYLRAKEKMLIFAVSDIINTFSFASFGIILVAILKYGVKGYLLAYLIAQLITNIFLFIAGKLYKEISIKEMSIKTLKGMIKYSAPFVPNDLSWWIMNVSDRYLLIYFLGFASSGIYAVSYKFMALINVLNSIFYQAWQVSAVKEYEKKDRDQFYSNVFYHLSTALIAILLIFSIVIKPFVKIMVGNEFEKAWLYLPFLMLGALFSAFSSFYGIGYIASKESKGAFTTSIYGALTNLGINILFIPLIGIQAAAISTMVAFLTMWLLRVRQTKKYFTIKVNGKLLFLNILLVSTSLFANYIDKFGIYIQLIDIIIFIFLNLNFLKSVLGIVDSYIKKHKVK
ncbi:MAG: oligosaccharide flippase family protein [Thermosipho sp. (in: Bacteria)]|nr:oligosaccharide flippase family protein [Thermosipho sp. (in: thermotogales)]